MDAIPLTRFELMLRGVMAALKNSVYKAAFPESTPRAHT